MSITSHIHTARRLALNGQAHEALTMLDDLGEFDFATYHIVRGECYYSLKQFGRARDEFKRALRLAPNSPRAEILLQLSSEMTTLERSMRPLPGIQDLVKPADADASPFPTMGKLEQSDLSSEDEPIVATDEIGIVSETLANIMARQGKFEEARKVYIQLSRLNPDRYEYFRERMDELGERMKAEG
jgi:tetratricopeptide (TPR) repeat protein